MMIKQTEIKKLQKENDKIRDKLQEIFEDLGLEQSLTQKDLWDLINGLVENELEQEELCNE